MTNSKERAEWITIISTSSTKVDRWLAGIPDEDWFSPIEGTWTIKDLVGHLAAWSELLLDQIEALAQNNPGKITQIDIDNWNAAQIAARSDWSVAETREEWEQSTMRARSIVNRLPEEILSRQAYVPWTKEPVSIGDLLDLWLLHITQHQNAWEA